MKSKIFVALLGILGLFNIAFAAPNDCVNIPDTNLKKLLYGWMGNANWQTVDINSVCITESQAAVAVSPGSFGQSGGSKFYVGNTYSATYPVSSLVGLNYFKKLDGIELNNMPISDISILNSMPWVNLFHCGSNGCKISDISFFKNYPTTGKLTSIRLDSNLITNLSGFSLPISTTDKSFSSQKGGIYYTNSLTFSSPITNADGSKICPTGSFSCTNGVITLPSNTASGANIGASWNNTTFANFGGNITIHYSPDSIAPTGSITASTTGATNQDVVLTLTTNEPIQTPAGWTKINDTTYTLNVPSNQTVNVNITDVYGNTNSTPISYNVTNIDKTAPIFEKIVLSGNNLKNPTTYAKLGDIIKMILSINPSDTWKTGNNVSFNIGTGSTKNTGAFTFSNTPITSRNSNYTVSTGDNGTFSFTGLIFFDAVGNAITGFSSPYAPNPNIIVDTINPVINFSDDVNSSYNSGDTINIFVSDVNPDTNSYKYAFVPTNTCDSSVSTGSFSNPFTSGSGFVINTETNNGKYICVRVDDMAGNISYKSSANPLKIDITPPVVTLSGTDMIIGVGSGFSDPGANWVDTVDGSGHILSTSGSVDTNTAGTYTLTYFYKDSAGNISNTVTRTVVVKDMTPPETFITTGSISSGGLSNQSTQTFNFSSSENGTFECRIDGGTWATCPANYTTPILSDGTHTLEVRSIDNAGNTDSTPASISFSIDTTKPSVTISTPDNTILSGTTANITFSGSDVGSGVIIGYECQINGGAWTTCNSPFTASGLNEGNNTISVRATDNAGNISDIKSINIIVDTTKPVVTLNGGDETISAGSGYSDAGASWTDNNNSASGNVLTGSWGTIGSFAMSGDVNSDVPGTYYVQYLKVDDLGNMSEIVTRTIIVKDSQGPTITLSGSNNQTVEAGENYVEQLASCVDNVDSSCSVVISGTVDTNIPGTYTITYTATDSAGNITTTTREIIVKDRTPPVIVLSGYDMNISQGSSFSDPGANWTDKVDGSGFVLASSGVVDTNTLGTYTLQYWYIDQAGNQSNIVTREVKVIDNTSPETNIISGPTNGETISTTTASFGFVSTETGSTFECRLDSGAWETCTSIKNYDNLAEGNHTFEVRSIDLAGNVDSIPATLNFVVKIPIVSSSSSSVVSSSSSSTSSVSSSSLSSSSSSLASSIASSSSSQIIVSGGGGGGGWTNYSSSPTTLNPTTPNTNLNNNASSQAFDPNKTYDKYKNVDSSIFNASIQPRCFNPLDEATIYQNNDVSMYFRNAHQMFWSYQLTNWRGTLDYEPTNYITRAQAAKFLTQFAINVLCRTPNYKYTNNFKDIQNYKDQTLVDYIKMSYEYGIFHGDDKGNFYPGEYISKDELSAVLMRLVTNSYSSEPVGDWAKNYRIALAKYAEKQLKNTDRDNIAQTIYSLYKNNNYDWRNVGYVMKK